MSYVKELQVKIEQLQDTVDSKDLELRLLESQIQDDLGPSLLASKITCTLAEMLGEIMDFEKYKGSSEKSAASKKRILDLIFDAEKLNSLTTQLFTLKSINREMFLKYQLLRVENSELSLKIENMIKAEKF